MKQLQNKKRNISSGQTTCQIVDCQYLFLQSSSSKREHCAKNPFPLELNCKSFSSGTGGTWRVSAFSLPLRFWHLQ